MKPSLPFVAADRIWAEINAKPLGKHRFGAAISERARDTIPAPYFIAEPTLRVTRKELRQPACTVCGNNGRTHCGCEVTVPANQSLDK